MSLARHRAHLLGALVVVLTACTSSPPVPQGEPPAVPSTLSDDMVGMDAALPMAIESATVVVHPELDVPAPVLPGERWTDLHRSSEACADYRTTRTPSRYRDPFGPKRKFGFDNYSFKQVEISRNIDGEDRRHCVSVYYPSGFKSADGKVLRVKDRIDDAWFRLIERTMARLPWMHLQQVHAMVIDNRPILHGVAPFSRDVPSEDARDGHTIWLNERLFTQPNHWAHGNYGHYWAYHVQRNAIVVDNQPADHQLFSPVLIHEIGHIVNYNVINKSPADPTCPSCSWMCGDLECCDKLEQKEREAFCATAYCTGFGFSSGTENWAELYRWFYQGSTTRELVKTHFPSCAALLTETGGRGINDGRAAPWEDELEDLTEYEKTRWDSCSGACKDY